MPIEAKNKDSSNTEHILFDIFSIVNFLFVNLALGAIHQFEFQAGLHKIMMIDKCKYIYASMIINKFSLLLVSVIIFIFIRFLKF